MFAASRGISSRIVGSTRRKNVDAEEKQKRKVPLRQRLYVPCMWPTCASCLFGLIIFAAGFTMVVLGYLAECFSQRENNDSPANNTLNSVIFDDPSCLHYHLRKLSYIGPLIMAIGAFGIIVSCVVVCETRDKVLELSDAEGRTLIKKRPNFYELILMELRRQEARAAAGWCLIVNSLFL